MKSSSLFLFRFLVIVVLGLLISETTQAKSRYELKFKTDKTFKIAQFTDIHWDNNSVNHSVTIATIENVLGAEKPDFIVLTGDIVTKPPAREGWLAVTRPFVTAKIPWTVTLGNHDDETGISRDEIFRLLEKLPYFMGKQGPNITGTGNNVHPVKASGTNKVAALIYCFDSNSYMSDKKLGTYDRIHFDQIAWYRKTSQKFTHRNQNTLLPALAFFHIPLPEYNYLEGGKTTVGIKGERVSCADVNSGIFASFLDMKDVIGIITGHDHDNNFIGIHQGIAMGFGQVTGADAYGKLLRGSRIIVLGEGKFAFSSWIRTHAGEEFNFIFDQQLSGSNP